MAGSWESFFVAQVGASAALTGLVFVALSINLARIIGDPGAHRPGRGGSLAVAPAVLVGLLSLMSDASVETVGAWCFGVALIGFFVLNRLLLWVRAEAWRTRPHPEFVGRIIAVELAIVAMAVGAAVLLSGSVSGFDWIAVGGVACLVVGIGDAWVLLVEILR